MNCEHFEPMLVDVARGATNSEALAHVAACPRCALRLANERALSDDFAGLAASLPEAPLALESRLLAEFGKISKRRTVFTRGRIAPAAGIAALVIVALTWRVPAPVAPGVVRFADISPVMPKAALVTPVTSPIRATQQRSPRRVLRAKMRKAIQPTEPADDFIPIPYADPLTRVERAEVVRVNVGRPGGTPVQADVVLGQDGLVRAIRFLETSQ